MVGLQAYARAIKGLDKDLHDLIETDSRRPTFLQLPVPARLLVVEVRALAVASRHLLFLSILLWGASAAFSADGGKTAPLWALQPVVRPDVPAGVTDSPNPIDAFIAAEYQGQGAEAGRSGRQADAPAARLSRPHRPAADARRTGRVSPDRVAGRLRKGGRPASRQRAARRPLRPALARRAALRRRRRADDRRAGHPPLARLGDQRPQQRPAVRSVRPRATDRLSLDRPHADVGHRRQRSRVEPRPDDLFALGFLARGAVIRDGKECAGARRSPPSRRCPPPSWA